MSTILFLVESPHKAETLKHILGKQYTVMATVGHMMDLDPLKMSIDIENNFEPIYINNRDKTEVIAKIKSVAKKVDSIIFASDPDREGEMIAWSAAKILGVERPRRVTYTEITKPAILEALKHPRDLDMNLIDGQKTRRILDRIVGYEISPLLVKILSIPHLSAGRVQSVVARLIVDKENEIQEFMKNETSSFFKFTGQFRLTHDTITAVLYNIGEVDNDNDHTYDNDEENTKTEKGIARIVTETKAKELMEKFCKSKFIISDINDKIINRNPSPPFSTASMQQASANKLGFTVKRTMNAAQNLYEAGYITYLRTDSVNLSDEAIINIGKYITSNFGSKYHRVVHYKSKGKNTQEAHEAIRPTDINTFDNLSGKKIGNDEIKLYSLIWKRAVASQMSPAKIKEITVHIDISTTNKYEFISKTETVEFAGFLKVYNIEDIEKTENEYEQIKTLPKKGDELEINDIVGKQTYRKPPARYNDGSLVNKIKPENLNIGRPATTQSIITKIQERGYIRKGDIDGIEKDIIIFSIKRDRKLKTEYSKIMLGKETNRFIPTELGIKVNEFLMKYFPDVMDYKFTSEMEDKLDEIAEGKIKWLKVMKNFYGDFHISVEKLKKESKEILKSSRKVLGLYPNTNEEILVTMAKYGPVIKMKRDKKYIYAPIQEPLTMETITLDDAIKLFEYPKNLGKYNDHDILLQKGKYGFYLKYNGANIAVGDNSNITLNNAINEIEKKESKNLWKAIEGKTIYKILDGKFGLYINVSQEGVKKKGINVKLPKDTDIETLTLDMVKDIVSKWKPRRQYTKKKAT